MAKKENLVVKTEDQLATQLTELKPSRVREVRRTIARIKTLQSARARDAAKA